MPKCIKCSKEATTSIKSAGELCGECFCDIIDRRVKKYIREEHKFKKNERILIVDDGSVESNVMKELIGKSLGGLPVKIEEKQVKIGELAKIEGKYDKIILPYDGNDRAASFLDWLMNKKTDLNKEYHTTYLIQENKKIFSILSFLLDEEIKEYARIKKLDGITKQDPFFSAELKKFEEKYPGLINGLLKSAPTFRKVAENGKTKQ